VPPLESGLFLKGEARDVASIKAATGENYVLVSLNNDKLRVFKRRK
jgi:hypothetical protein